MTEASPLERAATQWPTPPVASAEVASEVAFSMAAPGASTGVPEGFCDLPDLPGDGQDEAYALGLWTIY